MIFFTIHSHGSKLNKCKSY